MSDAPEQVRSYFDRWRRLEEEKAAIAEDLKELFAEAKAEGYDTKAMRAAFRLKARADEDKPEDAEHRALVEVYLDALGAPHARPAGVRPRVHQAAPEVNTNSRDGASDLTSVGVAREAGLRACSSQALPPGPRASAALSGG